MTDPASSPAVTELQRAIAVLLGTATGAAAVGILAVLVRVWRGDFG